MHKHLLTLLLALAPHALPAQTPQTNDVRLMTPVVFNWSTNQFSALQWYYRAVTNAWPSNELGSLPTFAQWNKTRLVDNETRVVNDYARQLGEQETARASFRALAEFWKNASDAQRSTLLQTAGLTNAP